MNLRPTLISGLLFYDDAIDARREAGLVRWVDDLPPAPTSPSRHRIDLYGHGPFNAGYGSARLVSDRIPVVLAELAGELRRAGVLLPEPDAVTVSEYLPGQGVAPHTDRPEAGPVIVGVSLLADATVDFVRDAGEGATLSMGFVYPRRSVMRMEGECRSDRWRHAIRPVTARRISIVYRRSGD